MRNVVAITCALLWLGGVLFMASENKNRRYTHATIGIICFSLLLVLLLLAGENFGMASITNDHQYKRYGKPAISSEIVE
jgi:uncharacterized membrane protein